MKTHVEFFNGQKMPILGLGTWQAQNPKELEDAMNTALEAGYRHFDTAYLYENEGMIGEIIQKWLKNGKVTREELFITTKLPPTGMDESRVEHFLQKSLKSLQLDYVDLYLLHVPIGFQYIDDAATWPKTAEGEIMLDMGTDHLKIWAAMEKQVEAGRAKAIGLSNFKSSQIERIVKNCKILPANLQSEAHVYFQNKEVRETCKKHGITFCAYAPFGSPGRKELYAKRGQNFVDPGILNDPVVLAIAKAHGKTSAQVLLRFLAQQDVVVIPKSVSSKRIHENAEIFDFELSGEEMKALEKLERGERLFKPMPGTERHPECFA